MSNLKPTMLSDYCSKKHAYPQITDRSLLISGEKDVLDCGIELLVGRSVGGGEGGAALGRQGVVCSSLVTLWAILMPMGATGVATLDVAIGPWAGRNFALLIRRVARGIATFIAIARWM
eukprot:3180384-Pleurochrysis_carterae.AAC.2